jgi:serine/threonine protein kinase
MGAAVATTGRTIGRYVLFDEIASGGMATIHLGRMVGAVGITRTVAIKRLHPHLARDLDFVEMFLDEARIAARIRHPNVVGVLDVVHEDDELFLVMDYVQGETLSKLWRSVRPGIVPARIAVTTMVGVLHGLHAAHEATNDHGQPLDIVHRDVSPQNVMLGTDGVARVLDFGVAKAAHRVQSTQDGMLKGKIAYMSSEQILGDRVDRRADVYSAAVVLWETLTGERLFDAESQGRTVRKILDEDVPKPSSKMPGLPPQLDEAIMRGLDRSLERRWQTAREFAAALERAMPPAHASEIGEWVSSVADSSLGERAKRVKEIESRSDITAPAASGSQPRIAAATEMDIDVQQAEADTSPRPLQLKTMPLELAPTKMPVQIKTVALDIQPAPPPAQTPTRLPLRDSSPEAVDELLSAVIPSLVPPRPRTRSRKLVLLVIFVVLAAVGVTSWLLTHGTR